MTTSEVQISVVIPAYNYGETLPRAAESVLRQLDEHAELIIIDDGSTDNTAVVMAALEQAYPGQFRAIRQVNAGLAAVRNRGIDEARGGLRPDDKLQVLQQLHKEGRKVLMLGDGVNDVPVLAAADISVAMGSATDLAKTSADAVLLSNRLDALVQAFSLARRTRRVIIENLLWAGLYNGLMLPFAALGWITPVWAAVGMSISSLTVVLNALRLTRLPSAQAHSAPLVTRPLPA